MPLRLRTSEIAEYPPFGGEEEAGIRSNFPADKQTSETALLFLQLIMRKLRRTHRPSPAGRAAGGEGKGGRAAVVVPNGTLFGDGVCGRIKHELLTDFNLHTIVRLPNGVFAPYTSIPTNLLFFDRAGPTKTIWYYEQPLPEGRKNYSKTKPIQFEEFADCLAWWKKRKENDRAWKVPAKDVIKLDDAGNLVSVIAPTLLASVKRCSRPAPPARTHPFFATTLLASVGRCSGPDRLARTHPFFAPTLLASVGRCSGPDRPARTHPFFATTLLASVGRCSGPDRKPQETCQHDPPLAPVSSRSDDEVETMCPLLPDPNPCPIRSHSTPATTADFPARCSGV